MHTPNSFKQEDDAHLKEVIREYPFATLITHSETGVDAMHLPVMLANVEGRDVIQAHIARSNKVWESVENGSEVLLIFNGPNCYVSPSYYPTKEETGKAVPTWNYVVVHLKGKISFIHDEKWIYNVLDSLTHKHESNQKNPWAISDAPDAYIDKMLSAVVGVEVSIDSIKGQWKLSQNQPAVNKVGVVKGLLERGGENDVQVSHLVKERL